MRRRTYLGALCGLAVTSGCLRLSSEESTSTRQDTERTRSATTTVPERTTTSSIDPFPPYVSADGTTEELADYYKNYVGRRSFTLDYNQTDLIDGSIRAWQVQYADGNAVKETRDGSNLEMYYGDDAPYWRQSVQDGFTYGRAREWPGPPNGAKREHHLTHKPLIADLLRGGDWASAAPRDDGSAIVTATTVETPIYLTRRYNATAITAFDGELLVTENGVIADLDVELAFDPKGGEDESRIRERVTTTDIGLSSVREPSWYDTAPERAPQVDVRIDDANEFVVFEHQGGNPIEPETNVVLFDRDNARNWGYRNNQKPFEAGDTVYLWMDQDDHLKLRRGSRPTTATPQSLDRQLSFWMHRHGAEYFGNVEL